MGSTQVVEKEGTHKVKVSNRYTLLGDELIISYRDCTERIHIPNVFSPNGYKANETFFIEGLPNEGCYLEDQ